MVGPADPIDDVLLDCLLDGTESTTLVVEMLAEDGFVIDPEAAQAALERLAAQALVFGDVGDGGDHGVCRAPRARSATDVLRRPRRRDDGQRVYPADHHRCQCLTAGAAVPIPG